MNRLRNLAWLCRRVLLRREADWSLTVTIVVGVFLLSLLAIASATVPFALAHHADRADALTPVVDASSAADDEHSLRLIDPQITNIRRWDGREIRRYFYVPGEASLIAPGVPTMPAKGEFYASPDLVELLDEGDPVVRNLFENQVLIGRIGQDGLAQPHELTAIIGAEQPMAAVVEVTDFGQSDPLGPVEAQEERTSLNRFIAVLVVSIVWLPAIAFLVVVSRLSAGQRQLRARALRLVGLSWSEVRAVVAVEMTLLALPGALAALLLHLSVRDSISRVPGTSLGFFPADTEIPWWVLISAAAMPAAVAATITAFTISQDSLSRPQPKNRGISTDRVGKVILFGGLGLLLVVPIVGGGNPFGVPALWAGSALGAAGLALAGPTVTSSALSRLATSAKGGGSLVGLRVASRSSPSSMRLGSLMGMVVILLLAGTAFQNVLNGGSSDDWDQRLTASDDVPMVANDLLETLTVEEVKRIVPSSPVVEQTSMNASRQDVAVVVATCTDLTALTGTEVRDCTGAAQWISRGPSSPSTWDAVAEALGKIASPAPEDPAVALENAPESFDGALLVPPEKRGGLATSGGSFFVLASSQHLEQQMAAMSSAAPATQFDLGQLDRHNPDTQDYPEQIEWLTIGASASLLMGLLGLLAVAVGDTRDRARNLHRLRLLGAPRRELASAHFWSVGSPLIGLGILATGLGWLTAHSMHALDERADYSLSSIAVMGGAIIVGAVIICLATWSDALRSGDHLARTRVDVDHGQTE